MLFYLSFPVLSTSVTPTHKTALLRVTGPLAHSTNSDPDPMFSLCYHVPWRWRQLVIFPPNYAVSGPRRL